MVRLIIVYFIPLWSCKGVWHRESLTVVGVRARFWYKGYTIEIVSVVLYTHKTLCKNKISEEETIFYGVPQGAVIGPTMSILYIEHPLEATISCFAENTAIFFEANKWQQLTIL